jgi:5-methyltetrahydropteroyltriglutamate--homocysteine methyltransferase
MKQSSLVTTVVGSFPKPKYLPIEDWFDATRKNQGMNTSKITRLYTDYSKNQNPNDEKLFIKAAKEIINLQLDAGIMIPTDGEVRRENYIHYHCRYLDGFDFDNLEFQVWRDGAYESYLPAIRNKIFHNQNSYSVHDFKASQNVSPVPIKFTLPGPLTIMDTAVDCCYFNRPKLNYDLAETINKEILALVDAGCSFIQVDEPLFARQVDDALSFGMEGIDRCFHKVPSNVTKILHLCCGYPDHLDDVNYKKADPESYFILANHIDQLPVNQISIEDAHCCNDLNLLEHFKNSTVILGSIAIAKSQIEKIDDIENRIRQALEHIDKNRLVIAPDCGLGLLNSNLAVAKLKVMCEAASRF